MKVDELLDDIEEKVEFPVSEGELLDEFGDSEVQLSGESSADVPVEESAVATLAESLEREETQLEGGEHEEHTYDSREDIRDSLVPPQMW